MGTPGYFDEHSLPLDQRLADGLHTVGLALQQLARREAQEAGLSATQARILALLAARDAGTASDLAGLLGISLPTVSDSVSALVARGLVTRRADPARRRRAALSLTPAGAAAARRATNLPDQLATALGTLSDDQQASLLTILAGLLRALQEDGRVPAQRMCLTCTAFRPHVRRGARPHQCALVGAPMAPAQLRLLCDEHEAASQEEQFAAWQRFLGKAG